MQRTHCLISMCMSAERERSCGSERLRGGLPRRPHDVTSVDTGHSSNSRGVLWPKKAEPSREGRRKASDPTNVDAAPSVRETQSESWRRAHLDGLLMQRAAVQSPSMPRSFLSVMGRTAERRSSIQRRRSSTRRGMQLVSSQAVCEARPSCREQGERRATYRKDGHV